ncbi:serine protease [Flagelloscypha sp. PMI_526]|nr:serine protease [Flagelloscypha sp. PMI_526]
MFRMWSTIPVLAAIAPVVFAGPFKRAGASSGRLIVTVKEGVDKSAVLDDVNLATSHGVSDWSIINAFVVDHSDDALNALLAHPEVVDVEEEGEVSLDSVTQNDAPWGPGRFSSLDTLSGDDSTLTFNYTYDETAAGTGVDVYVLDTGILLSHVAFEGRARWGATFGNYGHGSHVAGTVGSSFYGVAKNVSLIAVKVLPDHGNGGWANFISGVDWVVQQAAASGRPSVLSASLGGSPTPSVDAAVEAAVAAGVHVVVSAGNNNEDADGHSPARAPSVITVGATTIGDARSDISNYGPVVDIFAPGQNVISCDTDSDTSTKSLSGTSMATPHVSGLVAYLISAYGNKTPAEMSDFLKSLAVVDKLANIPDGTSNLLAHLP